MAKHSEHTTRDGRDLLVGHGDNVIVAHELSSGTPQRITRETVSPTNGAVRERQI